MGKVPDTIYDKTFRGGWRKFINRRKDVTKVDTTVVTPSGKKLRSNVELLKFLRENPSYLKEINPREVNFDKNPEHPRKCSGTVKKFIQNVEELRSEHDLPPLVKCCKYIFILIICKGAVYFKAMGDMKGAKRVCGQNQKILSFFDFLHIYKSFIT